MAWILIEENSDRRGKDSPADLCKTNLLHENIGQHLGKFAHNKSLLGELTDSGGHFRLEPAYVALEKLDDIQRVIFNKRSKVHCKV